MKRALTLTTLLVAILFSPMISSGQVRLAAVIDSANFVNPTNPQLGATATYSYRIQNLSNQTYIGPLATYMRVGGITMQMDSIANDTLVPGDTVGVSFPDSINARYSGGINIVVIWPTAPNVTLIDTGYASVEIIGLSIGDPIAEMYQLDVYPNPSSGTIRFKHEFSRNLVSSLQLYDSQGRLMRDEATLPREIELYELPAGIYFLNVNFGEEGTQRFKVVKN